MIVEVLKYKDGKEEHKLPLALTMKQKITLTKEHNMPSQVLNTAAFTGQLPTDEELVILVKALALGAGTELTDDEVCEKLDLALIDIGIEKVWESVSAAIRFSLYPKDQVEIQRARYIKQLELAHKLEDEAFDALEDEKDAGKQEPMTKC